MSTVQLTVQFTMSETGQQQPQHLSSETIKEITIQVAIALNPLLDERIKETTKDAMALQSSTIDVLKRKIESKTLNNRISFNKKGHENQLIRLRTLSLLFKQMTRNHQRSY